MAALSYGSGLTGAARSGQQAKTDEWPARDGAHLFVSFLRHTHPLEKLEKAFNEKSQNVGLQNDCCEPNLPIFTLQK